jgi:hypothetical protein
VIKSFHLICCILIIPIYAFSQNPKDGQSNPKKVLFVTEDIERFWEAFDSTRVDSARSPEIFDNLYLKKGTYGLKELNKLSIKGANNLATAVNKYSRYYQSIREHTYQVNRMEKQTRRSLKKMKRLYPAAIFPDIYFLIGDMNAAGKPTKSALLIGTEVYSADENSNFENVYPPFQTILKSLTISKLPQVVAHELIHYQQSYYDINKNLLGTAIMEGSADFIAELITNVKMNAPNYDYGSKHERELWAEFINEAKSSNINKWMWNSSVDGKPGDLGYYIGYKIVQSYYENCKDKRHAIQEILNVKDFDEFLLKSRYGIKFN